MSLQSGGSRENPFSRMEPKPHAVQLTVHTEQDQGNFDT